MEINMPKVSVIVPVYNVEQYLSRCLDSIINQTLKDIEIICVNDGSADGSQKILEDYRSRDPIRIKIVVQSNQGLSAARNSGLNIATGEYIGFVDSDDWIDINYYETLYREAKNNKAEIAVASTYFVSEKLYKQESDTITKDFLSTLKILKNGSVWDKIFSRQLIERTKSVFPKGLYFEDNVFLINTTLHANKVVFTSKTGYYYFQNPNGICRKISSESTIKKDRDAIIISNMIRNICKKRTKEEKKELERFISCSLPVKKHYKNYNFHIPLFSIEYKQDNILIKFLYLQIFKLDIKSSQGVKTKKMHIFYIPIFKERKNYIKKYKKYYLFNILFYYKGIRSN